VGNETNRTKIANPSVCGEKIMKLTDKEIEGYAVLCAEMPSSLAMELVEFRREKKAKITARIARALLKEYKLFGDIEKAIELQMVRNWTGFDVAWTRQFIHQPSRQQPLTPFQARHQSAVSAFDRALGQTHEQPARYDFDLAKADYRTH